MADRAPVAFFGFDAAELTLVRRGLDEGWLPTLAGLIESGRYADLSPVPSGFYNTSWATLVTGNDVGEHQAVLDRKLESGSYRIVDVSASSIPASPFWKHLSDAGLRSTVASIYSAPVVPSLKGTQVAGWGAIDPYYAKFDDRIFDPPEIAKVLRRAAGRRPGLYRITVPRTTSEYRAYRDRMLQSVDEQTRGLTALVEETDWDFFFGSFGEPHQAGHLLWHLVDPEHPGHDPTQPGDVRDALVAIYRAVDAGIGRLIERLPDGCRAFVVNPHGMMPSYVDDPIELVLELGGWLTRREGIVAGGFRQQAKHLAWTVARRTAPMPLRIAVQSRLRNRVRSAMPLAHVDWQRTKAFSLPSDLTSYVRVNLAGREPEGIVQPGDEYDRFCDELTEVLGTLTHADSGRPAVERIVRTDRYFGKPVTGGMPDLCVVWDAVEPVRRLALPGRGTVDAPNTDPRTGQHRHRGFMVGVGPGLEHTGETGSGNLMDVAPTALVLLGVDRPAGLPGTPIAAYTGSG
jgi:predicted AlkP superfamily phosphohydrolase/phosphomutase